MLIVVHYTLYAHRTTVQEQLVDQLWPCQVLKSNQLIDVEQEDAYGDITLLLNPKVLSEQL